MTSHRSLPVGLRAARAPLSAAILAGLVALSCKPGAPTGLPDAPADVNISVDSVALSQSGEAVTLTAVALDDSGSPIPGTTFSWASSDESVATVDAAGVVTAVASGIALITATADGVSSDPVTVTVRLPIADIDVQPEGITLAAIGEQQTLTATATDATGAEVPGVTYTWDSSNETVATVSAAGVVTAVATGGATVTASAQGVTSGPVAVAVMLSVASIDVTPSFPTLTFVGDTATLTATARDATGRAIPGVSFTWASSDQGVVDVSNAGLITAVANGTATVTAQAGGVTSNNVTVTVQQVVVSISVTPASLSFTVVGQSSQLTATALDSGGTPVPGVSFTWASNNQAVATVDQAGLVTAAGSGVAQVTASESGGIVSNVVNVRVILAGITFDAASSTAAVSTTSVSWQHTIGGGSNRLLVVGATAEAADSKDVDVSSVTFNGVDLARQVQEKVTTSGGGFTSKVEIWVLDEVRLPTAGTYSVVVTYKGPVAEAASGSISFENVDQSSPTATARSNSLLQQSIATNITTQAASAWVVDVVHGGSPGSFTPGAGQTERFDVGLTGSRAAASTIEIATPGSVTVTQTHSTVANRLVHAAIVLAPE